VTENVIRKATFGMKESETSVNAVLNNLFSPLSKKRVKEMGLTDQEENRYVARLYQDIDGCGREAAIATGQSKSLFDNFIAYSFIRLHAGCFGHYATLRNYDSNLSRHEKAGEWLLTFDLLSSSMYGDGDFTLAHYLPYFLVPFYPLFQERGGDRVERNQADWDVSYAVVVPGGQLKALMISVGPTNDANERGGSQITGSGLAGSSDPP